MTTTVRARMARVAVNGLVLATLGVGLLAGAGSVGAQPVGAKGEGCTQSLAGNADDLLVSHGTVKTFGGKSYVCQNGQWVSCESLPPASRVQLCASAISRTGLTFSATTSNVSTTLSSNMTSMR